MLETNAIIHTDCLNLLAKTPSDSIDVVFADPPFNLNKSYAKHKDNLKQEEYLAWSEVWLKECMRVLKPSGSMFVHNIPKWLVYYAGILNQVSTFKHWISWNAAGGQIGKSLQPAHYGILYYAKDPLQLKFNAVRAPHAICRQCKAGLKDYGGKQDKLHPFGALVSDVWNDIHRSRHAKYRDAHPCQLPVHLVERLILMASEAGDTVLDPFIGTGTTAVAAIRLGRRYVGSELSEEYLSIAQKRISRELPVQLGGCFVSQHRERVITLRDKDWVTLSQYISHTIPSTLSYPRFSFDE